ncbi:hypothetical protein Rsub_07787 [Raphidocelis subcapitata]|uniref:Histone-binding protein RBBP4-like N-terminal domain-containing protein n=1 Tax=Raphidocelis subcapitata TaxID=307507 RepID=A0A2V0P718_9CHLO|nr:hypothetical protein Rsub_07787 [Raphidocelis subcapitata]|eukprot:GBF95359.1 hypothetical protein Rsub_07787 [Raphidocelis subcapitata]
MAPIMDDAQFRIWKTQLAPLIYDWFSNHNLKWPTQACRWGPKLESTTYKDRYRIYLSEQTDPKKESNEPPMLLVLDADICKPRVASAEVVAAWTDFGKCPFLRDVKAIVHPGEVNKIRELPQHPEVLVTHTDAPELYVWNIDKQPNMPRNTDKKPHTSVAEAVLTGHVTANEPLFALATSNAAPRVASGGPDKLVLLWDLQDAQDGILAGSRGADNATTTQIKARTELKGHKNTVEDVVFAPGSGEELVSVGDDKQVLFWDVRTGAAPVMRIEGAHGASSDIHCVDWNRLDAHMVATGAADGSLRVWDRRKLTGSTHKGSAAVRVFKQHTEAIMRIEWHPADKNVLASGGDDHLVLVWDLSRNSIRDDTATAAKSGTESGSKAEGAGSKGGSGSGGGKGSPPPELLFKHVGHRRGKVVDFQWCPSDPWTILSVSDDTPQEDAASPKGKGGKGKDAAPPGDAAAAAAAAGAVLAPGLSTAHGGGGTLQIWRVNDLIYRPEDEVIEELEQHRDWILEGTNEPPRPKVPPPVATQAGSGATGGGNIKEEGEGEAGAGGGGGGGGAMSTSVGGGSSKGRSGGGGGGGDGDAAEGSRRQQADGEAGGQLRGSGNGEVASQPSKEADGGGDVEMQNAA